VTKIALGTVQFGLSYGIANQVGQVSRNDAKAIISFARSCGIDTIDTAIAYGDSETRLGEIGLDSFKVITKLPFIPENCEDIGSWVLEQVHESLQRLNVSSIYGLLLHRPEQLIGPHGEVLVQTLEQLKAQGVVEKIGVSIYSPTELDDVMDVCEIDLVQAPFNLIDRRLKSSGWLQKLYNAGIEVHARSIFLQGVLLMPHSEIPKRFEHWRPLFNVWHSWLLNNNTSSAKACIGFVQAHPQISKIVVGVANLQQLEELMHASKELPNSSWPNINCSDEKLINPSFWSLL